MHKITLQKAQVKEHDGAQPDSLSFFLSHGVARQCLSAARAAHVVSISKLIVAVPSHATAPLLHGRFRGTDVPVAGRLLLPRER